MAQNKAGVNQVPCVGCNKVYFGETGRSFETRLCEPERDVRNCNEANAIFLHKMNFNHNIDWDNSKLLFPCNNYFTRKVFESSLIGSLPNFDISNGNFRFNKVFRTNILRAADLGEIT